MSATLVSLDAILYTALAALLTDQTTGPTAGKPFACVGRYAGTVPPEGISEVGAQYPCALLRFNAEDSTRDVRGFGAASIEDRATASWSVLVAVEDPRDIADGMIGTNSAPGLLSLVDAVIGACNGLVVAGAHMQQATRYAGVRAELVRRGVVYVYAVAFEAMRDAPLATITDTSSLVEEIRADVNLEGTGTAPNPLDRFIADPNA